MLSGRIAGVTDGHETVADQPVEFASRPALRSRPAVRATSTSTEIASSSNSRPVICLSIAADGNGSARRFVPTLATKAARSRADGANATG